MKTKDKFKAAFLKKSNLQNKLQERTRAALADLEQCRGIAETLPDDQYATALNAIDVIEAGVFDQVSAGAKDPGAAWVAMDDLCKQAAQKCAELLGLSKKVDKANPTGRFNRALEPTRKAITEARFGTRDIADDREGTRLVKAVEDLGTKVEVLVQAVHGQGDKPDAKQCETLEQYRRDAGDLIREIRGAQGLDPQPGTQRAASHAVVNGIAAMPDLGVRLNDDDKDAQGRTTRQDVQGRLEVFDMHFAEDPTKDPQAATRNNGMRLAAVTSVTADRISRDVNDPYIAPRIAQALLDEYEPDMGLMLTDGMDDQDAEKTLKLARALVMDDPITKLMTGKLDPIDAVQRIRDMAAVGEQDPSVMFKLLRQQFEMKLGSLTADEVLRGTKEHDQDAKGNFELSTITGELSPGQFREMTDMTQQTTLGSTTTKDVRPAWKPDGSGLALRPGSGQMHKIAAGDSFASLAQQYLGDATRWKEIFNKNKAVQVDGVITKFAEDGAAQLPKGAVGASLIVPSKLSILDQLEPYISAWDPGKGDTTPDSKVPKNPNPARKLDSAPLKEGEKPKISPEDIRGAFSKLVSPRDTARDEKGKAVPLGEANLAATQVPGLGQDHAPRAPLGSESDLATKKQRDAAEADKLQGSINDRQYAHLRLLMRADQEDRAAILAKEGKTVEELSLEKIARRYGSQRVTPDLAKKIAKAAEHWIATVPLTVTFTADRLFSDDKKNAPTHGTDYLSDVELTRGKEKVEDLVGRGENTEGQQIGTQGGNKNITGWKERGENYMRWRRDKDNREGRHDDLAYEDQQIFAAANPAFSKAKGGAEGTFGTNYYGSAHFLLRDATRNRCAFIVRAGLATGAAPPVQRKDIGMLIYDMLLNGPENIKFFDAMFSIASGGSSVTSPGLNWEAHLYGGFDMGKDAQAIYLPNDIDDSLRTRIQAFAKDNNIECHDIGSKPTGLELKADQDPSKVALPPLN